jgi:hypothetical protein
LWAGSVAVQRLLVEQDATAAGVVCDEAGRLARPWLTPAAARLAGVLDEVVCLLDTARRVPLGVELAPTDGAADVRFALVATNELPSVGAVHKVLSPA